MALEIRTLSPDSPVAVELIQELDADLLQRYTREWIHTLHPEDVVNPGLIFAVGYLKETPVACGALRPLNDGVAEVKRMFVRQVYRGRGYSKEVLAFLEKEARRLGFTKLRLETGSRLTEAVRLYETAGYRLIPRFGEYVGNPYSLCYEKDIDGASRQ